MMEPKTITEQLTQLHDSSLKELFETIDGHKAALHELVQQAHAELTALVGGGPQAEAPQVGALWYCYSVPASTIAALT
jgi:hypothetical protein